MFIIFFSDVNCLKTKQMLFRFYSLTLSRHCCNLHLVQVKSDEVGRSEAQI
ncbi:hypothetical protein Hanom_Chr06g00550151 [Helianthus anomalus]